MGGFPAPNFTPPPTSGGVPQWFTNSNPHSWFPGAPQYNFGLQQMLQQFGSFDPNLLDAQYQQILGEFPQISSALTAYGKGAQAEDISAGNMAATGMSDQLASQYGLPTAAATQGLGGGTNVGENVGYGTGQLGTNIQRQQGVTKASQVPGQIAEGQQQLTQEQKQLTQQREALNQQYQASQIKSLKQMLDLITGAAGSQYGYQQAQLGADRGQIALANAQSAEQQANLADIFSLFGDVFGQGGIAMGAGQPGLLNILGSQLTGGGLGQWI